MSTERCPYCGYVYCSENGDGTKECDCPGWLEVKALKARVAELELKVYPQQSIPLEDLFAPLKPCPFCGSIDLFNDDGMAIICRHCDATAPVMMWQFRFEMGNHET